MELGINCTNNSDLKEKNKLPNCEEEGRVRLERKTKTKTKTKTTERSRETMR